MPQDNDIDDDGHRHHHHRHRHLWKTCILEALLRYRYNHDIVKLLVSFKPYLYAHCLLSLIRPKGKKFGVPLILAMIAL